MRSVTGFRNSSDPVTPANHSGRASGDLEQSGAGKLMRLAPQWSTMRWFSQICPEDDVKTDRKIRPCRSSKTDVV